MYLLLEKKEEEYGLVDQRQDFGLLIDEIIHRYGSGDVELIAAKEIQIKRSSSYEEKDSSKVLNVGLEKHFPPLSDGEYLLGKETFDVGGDLPVGGYKENIQRKITKHASPDKPLEELIRYKMIKPAGEEVFLLKPVNLTVKHNVVLK